MAESVTLPRAYLSPPDSPLQTIGTQLGTLFSVTPGLSPNQSFEEGVTEDLLVEEAKPPKECPGHSLQPAGQSEESEVPAPVFKRLHPPTAAVKAL